MEPFLVLFPADKMEKVYLTAFTVPHFHQKTSRETFYLSLFFGSKKSEEIGAVWLELKGIIWDAEDKHQKSC